MAMLVRNQVTERNPPERCRDQAKLQRYLFLVIEGARLDAGGLRVALGDVISLQIGRGKARELIARPDSTQVLEVPDPRMSAAHARIVRTVEAFTIEDAGSTNGTLVNGEAIAAHVLRDGDVIELGQTIFLYRELEAEAPGCARSLDLSGGTVPVPGFATLDPHLALRLKHLSRVAPSSLSILLLGETGTGKEMLAHGLHLLSRRPGPFVAVNCGAIPQNLVESQLFGHVRGAFSGALKDEPGVVRSAQHGTLLLDEIGDLPLGSQAALLRVLQESEVRLVGSTQTVNVDVRIIAATHMPLAELIERGAFRRDLYARLAGYTFVLPPLRERRMDLGLVVAALLSAGKLGAPGAIRLQGDAARALVRHDWPMNVRELEQCLRAACVLSDDGVVTAEELPAALRAAVGVATARPHRGALAAATPAVADDPRARLIALLDEHGGNLSAVAKVMHTSRTQVYRLMERYGLGDGP